MIKDDLEALTGTIIEKDITKAVYSLVRDSECKKDIIRYLHLCRDTELREKLKGVMVSADSEHQRNATEQESDCGISLKEWSTYKGFDVSS